MSFSARLPGGRATFLCVAKERWPKERPSREHVLSTSTCSGFAHDRRGSPKARPCACGKLAHFFCAPAFGLIRRPLGVFEGSICAHDSPHPCGSPFGPPAAFKSAVHADLVCARVRAEQIASACFWTKPRMAMSKRSSGRCMTWSRAAADSLTERAKLRGWCLIQRRAASILLSSPASAG